MITASDGKAQSGREARLNANGGLDRLTKYKPLIGQICVVQGATPDGTIVVKWPSGDIDELPGKNLDWV